MATLPDLTLRAAAPRTARPVERISRPDPLPRHPDTARSPLGSGKGRGSGVREDLKATQLLPWGTRQARPGDAVSILILAQILGQDLRSPRHPSIRRDGAASGSDAYRRHGGEPASFPARAVIFRITV